MPRVTPKMQDDYEEFLTEIDMLLEDLQNLLKNSRGYRQVRVGYDADTLSQIEAFYLDALSGKEMVNVSSAPLNRIMLAFFGESLVQRVGGQWALDEVENDPAFGTPVVINWAKGGGVRFSPVERRDLLIRERKPFLREFIDYAANKEKFEADFFKEFE